MKWTRRLPTKPGWYWWLHDDGVMPEMLWLTCLGKSIGLVSQIGQEVRYMRGHWCKVEHPPLPKKKRKAVKHGDAEAILDAMMSDPLLIERPLVETDKGVRLGRPIARLHEIL